jgi:hypothetical protein
VSILDFGLTIGGFSEYGACVRGFQLQLAQ